MRSRGRTGAVRSCVKDCIVNAPGRPWNAPRRFPQRSISIGFPGRGAFACFVAPASARECVAGFENITALVGMVRPHAGVAIGLRLAGSDELSDDGIRVTDAVRGVSAAVAVEEYSPSGRGPAVLVLEYDREKEPIHAVWGIPAGHESPAVLITAYRPNPEKWDSDFLKRRK